MIHAFLLSLLLFFLPAGLVKEPPKVQALVCNTAEGKVRVSDLRDCTDITLSVPNVLREEYGGAKIIAYTFAYSPKAGKTPPAVENVTGGPKLTDFARSYIAKAVPGDLIIITNVKVETKSGIHTLDNGKGTAYVITD